MGYVGQAHLPVHVCMRASAWAARAGPGCGGRRLLSPPAPARAWGPGDWPGASAHLCSCPPLAEPLCYLILAFEGSSEHLAPLVRLVPWGRCGWGVSLAGPDNVPD